MSFDVRVAGLMAQAIRTNVTLNAGYDNVGAHAAEAMRRVTGCEVVGLRGDPAVMEGRLQCDGQVAPRFDQMETRIVLCTFQRATTLEPETIEDYDAFCV